MMKKAYFVDGYHGGIKGHMPLGSWADVLRRLRQRPDWKLCLDIEPISWDVLRRTDPRSYDEIKAYFAEGEGSRLELVAASYAQPFGWVIGGESNIRHLIRGQEVVREHFPDVAIDTYATQEPCWSSSYPQLLRSLGYKRAVLKNPGTAWGGYASGIDRETVLWTGPDGTAIPCVPRYECEALVNCWETEGGHMEPAFVDKCLAQGIAHPVGSFLQDLGWPAQPRLDREEIEYVTWREYMERIAEPPPEPWHFTQEDIRCTLPWGEAVLQRMSQEVRSAENKIIAAEKLASLAVVLRGDRYPEERLREAWDQLLLSQHHDAWICATTREGRDQWAWQAGAQSWAAESLSDAVLERAADSFRQEEEGGAAWAVRVFNLSGAGRKELTEVEIPAPGGTYGIRVRDADGNVLPSQIVPTRTSREDGSLLACKLLFEAEPPAMGYRTYAIEHTDNENHQEDLDLVAQESRAFAALQGEYAKIETDQYEMRIDLARGGVIAEWFDKAHNRSIVSPDRPFNEFAGFHIALNRWVSSTESPVALTIKENGPLRVVVEMKGRMADIDYVTTLTAVRGQRRVDFHVRLRYEAETWIGDPWEMAPEHRSTERRKSHHNTRYKLQARFPVSLGSRQIYKNAAFDVAKSRHADTHYERWDEIKHNIVLNWVDDYDESLRYGLAIFSDHTTDYSHSKNDPLALTLGWGGEGGFWWGKRPLTGVRDMRYAVLPHAERWDRAGVQRESACWSEPLLPVYGRSLLTTAVSLLRVTDPAIEISSVRTEGSDLLVRLYNTGSEASIFSLVVSAELQAEALSQVELDGKPKVQEAQAAETDRGRKAEITLQPHGLATLRLSNVCAR